MGYEFSGFFARAGQDVLDRGLQYFPGCSGRVIEKPFRGIGLEVWEYDSEANDFLYKNLPAWTENYPETIFVYIDALCFGGKCVYNGTVYQGGILLAEEKGDGA